jgi:hypothetical protein
MCNVAFIDVIGTLVIRKVFISIPVGSTTILMTLLIMTLLITKLFPLQLFNMEVFYLLFNLKK